MKRLLPLFLLVLALMAPSTFAQDGYQVPNDALQALVDAPNAPSVSLSPDGSTMLLQHDQGLPSIALMAAPELRLAGTRINPRNNGPSRAGYDIRLTLTSIDGASERTVTGLPDGALIGSGSWSLDGSKYAFSVSFDDRIELWTLNPATAEATRLVDRALNGVGGSMFTWMPDGNKILGRLRLLTAALCRKSQPFHPHLLCRKTMERQPPSVPIRTFLRHPMMKTSLNG